MRRRNMVVAGCLLLLLLLAFLFWAPVRFGIKKEISIVSPIYNVSGKLTDLRSWKQWNPELKTLDSASLNYSGSTNQVHSFLRAGDHIYTILQVNPAFILVREQTNGKTEYHSFYAFPDSSGAATRVSWIRSLSPLDWLKEQINPDSEMKTGLKNLKSCLEDPDQFYGFHISIEPVTDTLVITKRTTVAKGDRLRALQRLYKAIDEYARKNNIKTGDARMASFGLSGRDSVLVSAGVPAAKKAPEKNGITCLEMPKHGKMLTGFYEGAYPGLKALYGAMERYVRDKGLQKVAVPYEKYLSDPHSMEDSIHMKIDLCYPVY